VTESAAPGDPQESVPPTAEAAPAARGGLAGPLVLYTLLRVGLLVLLAFLLSYFMPLIVAAAFAVVLSLPLSYLLFGGPRRRVNAEMARATARRREQRDQLRRALAQDGDI
jgi:Flp pilus assembly protein TadB